jgi:hypothetical protein
MTRQSKNLQGTLKNSRRLLTLRRGINSGRSISDKNIKNTNCTKLFQNIKKRNMFLNSFYKPKVIL